MIPQIHSLSARDAACIVPLLLQVQALHVAHQPDLYQPDPDPGAVAAFLRRWLAQDGVTALIAGAKTAPLGYLIYEMEERPASVLRRAERRAMLHHICVDAAARRRGIGRALIAAMRARLADRSVDRIATGYGAFNTASAALMAEAGLTPAVIFALGPAGPKADAT